MESGPGGRSRPAEPDPGLEAVLRPGGIGSLELPHRIVTGAMHLGIERRDDGGAAMAAFYAARARGGAGLMVTGGAAVNRVGAGGRAYAVLDDPADQARLGRVADEVHAAGGLIALQLFHAGRYAFEATYGLQPVAPSAVYSRFSGTEPAAMTEANVEETIAAFAAGAAVARRLGFDAVEIMGSEGYLLDQFVSPLTNRRDDEWGGDADRRLRFPLAVLARVKAEAGPDVPVVVRFSGADLMDGGTPADEVAGLARALALAGADALNVGVGWHEARVPTVQAVVPPGAWVPVAEAVKAAVKAAGGPAGQVPVMASNRINRLELAESILAGTDLEFVSMARPWLADAELLSRARKGLPVNVCIGCNQACIDRSLVDEAVSCVVNPRAG
ncbi:MAG TPA: NADPH-dependent 2,4-dienoyl-CoA reductase, partial [Acidimicrobiales bacterium]|nr:NADPH-dependent 2,4-dienoyl-CoA reductase [Acidimicrobiales bacterium]